MHCVCVFERPAETEPLIKREEKNISENSLKPFAQWKNWWFGSWSKGSNGILALWVLCIYEKSESFSLLSSVLDLWRVETTKASQVCASSFHLLQSMLFFSYDEKNDDSKCIKAILVDALAPSQTRSISREISLTVVRSLASWLLFSNMD